MAIFQPLPLNRNWSTLLISILMISGLLFLGPAFRMIRRQKEQETKERDFLIRESHHNVKNNLQMLKGLISLQGLSEKSPAVKDTLKELELRIGSFLLLHEQVYGSSKNDLTPSADMSTPSPHLLRQPTATGELSWFWILKISMFPGRT